MKRRWSCCAHMLMRHSLAMLWPTVCCLMVFGPTACMIQIETSPGLLVMNYATLVSMLSVVWLHCMWRCMALTYSYKDISIMTWLADQSKVWQCIAVFVIFAIYVSVYACIHLYMLYMLFLIGMGTFLYNWQYTVHYTLTRRCTQYFYGVISKFSVCAKPSRKCTCHLNRCTCQGKSSEIWQKDALL